MITLPWHHAARLSLALVPALPGAPILAIDRAWPDRPSGHTLTIALCLPPLPMLYIIRRRPSRAHCLRLGLAVT